MPDRIQDILRMLGKDRAEKEHEDSLRNKAQNTSIALGTGGTLLGGASIAGGRAAEQKLKPMQIVDDAGLREIGDFTKAMGDEASPGAFTTKYVNQGGRLMRQKLQNGDQGWQLMKKLYSFPGFGLAAKSLGATDTEWTPGKQKHYESFSKGPIHGYRQLVSELNGELPLGEGAYSRAANALADSAEIAHGTAASRAYAAATEGGKDIAYMVDDSTFRNRYVQELTQELTPFMGRAAARVYAVKQMLQARKGGLRDDFNALMHAYGRNENAGTAAASLRERLFKAQGFDVNPANANTALDDVVMGAPGVKKLLAGSKLGLGDLPISTQEQVMEAVGKSTNPLLASISKAIHENYGGQSRKGYKALANTVGTSQNVVGKLLSGSGGMKRLGKLGLIGGGALGGAGLLGKLLNNPKVVEKQSMDKEAGAMGNLLRSLVLSTEISTNGGISRVAGRAADAKATASAKIQDLLTKLKGFNQQAQSAVKKHPLRAGALGAGGLLAGASVLSPNVKVEIPKAEGNLMPAQKTAHEHMTELVEKLGAEKVAILAGAMLGAGIGGTHGAFTGGDNAANKAVSGAATGALTGGGTELGAILGHLLAKKMDMGAGATAGTMSGGGILGGLLGYYGAKAMQPKKPKPSVEDGEGTAPDPAVGEGTAPANTPDAETGAGGQEAAEQKRSSDKSAMEKVAVYCSVGDQYKVRSGDDKDKKGVCIRKKRHNKREEYIDEDGASIRKSKNTETVTLKFDNGDTKTFDDANTQLQYCDSDDCAPVKSCIAADKEAETTKTAAEKKAFWGDPGYRYKVLTGDNKGKKGTLTYYKNDDNTDEYIDDDGNKIHKTKETYEVKLKLDEGGEATFTSPDTEIKRVYSDEENDISEPKEASADVKLVDDMDEAEKVAFIRRVINGDEGINQVIAHMKEKQAEQEEAKDKD